MTDEVICEAWAYINQNVVVADSGFETPEDAWRIMLGWPTRGEVADAKARGERVVRVKIVRAE